MRGMNIFRIVVFVVAVIAAIVVRGSSSKKRNTIIEPLAKPAIVIKDVEKKRNALPFPAGNLYDPQVGFQFAVFYLPKPSGDPADVLKKLCADKFKQFHETADVLAEGSPYPRVAVKAVKLADYEPPQYDTLQYCAHGLNEDQKKALPASQSVFVVEFASDAVGALATLKSAQGLIQDIAVQTGGLIWDEETREVFTPAEWQKRRLDGWKDALPKVPDHIVVHFYANGEFCRLVTLGMAKFGLPDVAIEDITRGSSRSAGTLINLACQTMAEQGKLNKAGELFVDVDGVKNAELKAILKADSFEGAMGKATLSVSSALLQAGDAQNRLLEITFPSTAAGGGLQQRQEAVLSSLFGSKDAIVNVNHDDELLTASARAKTKIKELFVKWTAGLGPNEQLLVKAPFKTPAGGNEWMWVEVTKWDAQGHIEGILENQPFDVPDLKSGAKVKVEQDSLFDYIHYLPDGKVEGNETGEIMRKRDEQGKK
jgi:uncharacterized protein YegJ (DUF2314 family)